MEIITKSNGYELSEEHKKVLTHFEQESIKRLGKDNIEKIYHFFYGDKLSMTDIKLTNKDYCNYNITSKSVHLCGHTCTQEEFRIFQTLCWNDECYPGNLF